MKLQKAKPAYMADPDKSNTVIYITALEHESAQAKNEVLVLNAELDRYRAFVKNLVSSMAAFNHVIGYEKKGGN